MADSDDPKTEDSAEKAYAAAAEAIGDKADSEDRVAAPAAAEAEPVEFPAKPKRARKAEPKPEEPAIAPEVLDVAPPVAEPAPKPRRVRAVTVKAAKPAAKRVTKAAAAKAAPAKSAPAKLRKLSVQKTKTAPKAASKTVPAGPTAAPKIPLLAQLKEIPMDMSTSIKDAVSGAQEKAKEAYTKGSAAAAEYGEFAKGNVEACVESGKILAAGLQEMGKKFVEDGKTAFETASADVKAMTSVKSPTDLFKLQTELMRRNFDTALSYSTKNAEAMVKLTSDAFAPISARVNLAVEKLKKAA